MLLGSSGDNTRQKATFPTPYVVACEFSERTSPQATMSRVPPEPAWLSGIISFVTRRLDKRRSGEFQAHGLVRPICRATAVAPNKITLNVPPRMIDEDDSHIVSIETAIQAPAFSCSK